MHTITPTTAPRIIDPVDVVEINDRVAALNATLARAVAKYGPAVEIRTDHGYSVGEYAVVRVDITHGRLRLTGDPLPGLDGEDA